MYFYVSIVTCILQETTTNYNYCGCVLTCVIIDFAVHQSIVMNRFTAKLPSAAVTQQSSATTKCTKHTLWNHQFHVWWWSSRRRRTTTYTYSSAWCYIQRINNDCDSVFLNYWIWQPPTPKKKRRKIREILKRRCDKKCVQLMDCRSITNQLQTL